ncbi:MAG: cobyric acid synthase CobQ, partial [Kangiellaceae bacterium]|nr:cobyric acid synthase CobQ [Kangiellaceae bacterium]
NISGYEIHCGTSLGAALDSPFCKITDQMGNSYFDGVVSEDKQIIGTYVHGLFEEKSGIKSILHWVSGKQMEAQSWNQIREGELNRLADCYEEYLDIEALIDSIE